MFPFTRSKPSERAAEIRAALQSADAELLAGRERLGVAIADSDASAARDARAEITELSARVSELTAALPVADRRAREAVHREEAEHTRAQHKAANDQRARRISAARKVDAAFAALGKAFDAYLATTPGGSPQARVILHRRSGIALRAAVLHHAPSLGSALGIARVSGMHRRPLADSEAVVLPVFDETES